jgi:hypothetical protein
VKDIFLCHTGADKERVERLAERLEAESIGDPRIAVWFDKWDIDGGQNILVKIESGLKQSRYVAVVLSPATTKADWPTLEWQTQVFDDPAGKRGRILPLLRHVFDPITAEPIEIPLPLRILKRYDFTDERRFEDAFAALLCKLRGQAPARGRGGISALDPSVSVGPEHPDELPDSLLSNLLPVTHLPQYVYGDECTIRSATAVIDAVHPRVPWLLSGGRLFTFHEPSSPRNPFRSILTGRLRKPERIADWLASGKYARLAIRLLNDGLRSLCRALNIWSMTDKREVFFFAIPKGRPRLFRWGRAGRPRTLAKIVTGSTGEPFGVHHAAQMRFIGLGGQAFLLIQPGWTFTSDGASPLPGRQRGMLSMRWGGRERNAAVLRNILMCALVLSKGRPEIMFDLGPEAMRVSTTPAHSQLHVGVRDDSLQCCRAPAAAFRPA